MKIALVAAAVAAVAGVASAQIEIYNFPLSGLQEVPANASPATGSATMTLDTATGAFSLSYNITGLLGTITLAHFHRNVAGSNGPVFYWLAQPGNSNPALLMNPALPVGATSASGMGTGTIPMAEIPNFLQGRVYMNVHTTVFGGGEVRGQVVPTPGALGLAGLAGFAALRRRRA